MRYKEIFRLKEMLEKEEIPFSFLDRGKKYMDFEFWQIVYPDIDPRDGDYVCSVIEGDWSWGREEDLLEIKGLLTEEEEEEDSVKGWLSAEEVFNRIKNHYKQTQEA